MPIAIGALGAVLATETWLRALDTADPTEWWKPATPNHPREEDPTP